ncbi:MAG: zinc ribbon domain-containing protein [Promethearchaeota archaeon]
MTDYRGSSSPHTSSTPQDRKKPRSASVPQVVQLTMCSECEATIHADETVCPHCGTPLPICSVCQHSIEYGESILICPHCNSQAHRTHILEFLKVKGTCPNCEEDLDEYELLEPDVNSDN